MQGKHEILSWSIQVTLHEVAWLTVLFDYFIANCSEHVRSIIQFILFLPPA